jgi:hypothetical protein
MTEQPLPARLEERIRKLLELGRTPPQVVLEMNEPTVGLARVLQAYQKFGIARRQIQGIRDRINRGEVTGDGAKAVRHFSPAEIKALEEELRAQGRFPPTVPPPPKKPRGRPKPGAAAIPRNDEAPAATGAPGPRVRGRSGG